MEDKHYRLVALCQEDIQNLQQAEKRLFNTLSSDYEALEIFTIQDIIKQYNLSQDIK